MKKTPEDKPELPFWERLSFEQMSAQQWESLCDGCARCCLHKLQDADTGTIHYTDIACKQLDLESCACSDYSQRQRLVPDCLVLSPSHSGDLGWLPDTCAYRLLDEGSALPAWHPLRTGDSESVHRAGISVRNRCVTEVGVHEDDFEEHIIRWVPATSRDVSLGGFDD